MDAACFSVMIGTVSAHKKISIVSLLIAPVARMLLPVGICSKNPSECTCFSTFCQKIRMKCGFNTWRSLIPTCVLKLAMLRLAHTIPWEKVASQINWFKPSNKTLPILWNNWLMKNSTKKMYFIMLLMNLMKKTSFSTLRPLLTVRIFTDSSKLLKFSKWSVIRFWPNQNNVTALLRTKQLHKL